MSEQEKTNVEETGQAEAYIQNELYRAQKNLTLTRVVSVASFLAIAAILVPITRGFANQLEPETAATITTGLVAQRLDEQGEQVKNYLSEQVPGLIRQAPDYVIQNLPNYRETVESKVGDDIERFATNTSDQLSEHFDTYLEGSKDDINDMLAAGQDPQFTDEMAKELRECMVAYFKESEVGGETIDAKLEEAFAQLHEVRARTFHLSKNRNLTDEEKKARRAIAIIMPMIGEKPTE